MYRLLFGALLCTGAIYGQGAGNVQLLDFPTPAALTKPTAGFEDGLGGEVLAGDELDLSALAEGFLLDQFVDGRVHFREGTGHGGFEGGFRHERGSPILTFGGGVLFPAYNGIVALTIEESFLPATLTAPPMTDEQFAAFCAGHPDLFFEMTAQGEIVVMPPNFTLTGIRNARLVTQLQNWADRDGRGVASDPSTGFVLPNGARRSPDAAWTSSERIARMEPASVETYWRLCPDFVVELRSQSDRLPVLRGKMREWIENGAQLAWLIDPDRRAVEVYRPGRAPEVLIDAEAVEGEGPVVGLRIEMRRIWNPLAA